jgi:hypothetical protein
MRGRSVGMRVEGGKGFFEGRGVFDVEAGLGAIDLAQEATEHFAGADFDEVCGVLGDERLHGFDPANGCGDLADEGVAQGGGGGFKGGVDVDGDGHAGVGEIEAAEQRGEAVLRGLHEGAVEGRADREHEVLRAPRSLQSAAARSTAA